MRQNDRRAAAPLNAEPRWPAGYIEVLRQAGAKDKTVPFCLQWVRRFVIVHTYYSPRENAKTAKNDVLLEYKSRINSYSQRDYPV